MDFDLHLPSGRIRARRWGAPDAPLLLCVHGLSANLSSFGYLADGLAGPERQVVAMDLRGCGRSAVTPPGSYGLDAHTADVLAVAGVLGFDEFDLAGWSLGALIAMRVALRAGSRLRSVSLIDHVGPVAADALVPVRNGLVRLDDVVPEPEDYLRAIRSTGVIEPWSPFWDTHYTYELEQREDGWWSPTTSRAAAEEDLFQRWPRDWGDHWAALTMPSVLVRALRPLNGVALIPDSAVAALRAANPAVRVTEAPDSNHFTCMVDPVTLAAVADVLT